MSESTLSSQLSSLNLPDVVSSALLAIMEDGKTADSQESQTLDFKEDPMTARSGRGNDDAQLISMILKATVCMANGNDEDSYVVLGIKDDVGGPEALSGTSRDADWIRRKVFNGTDPNLTVDVDEFYVQDKRLLLIRIPHPLQVYARSKGEAWYRSGTECQVLKGERLRRLEWERRNPDVTAKVAEIGEEELELAALENARQLLRTKRAAMGSSVIPETNHGLLRELGLVDRNGKLLMAGEIFFARSTARNVAVRHLYYPVQGSEPRVEERDLPLVGLFAEIQALIESHASQEVARVDFGGGQEVPIPSFPRQAVDEVVSNALLHRDWVAVDPIVIKQTPRTLTVISPGGFPAEVSEKNLLTTRFVPRNPTLMNGARRLGLAEESSRGFDRMWVSMLASGRRAPVVEPSEFSVSVTLDSGKPDVAFVRGLAAVAYQLGVDLRGSVNALIVVRYLVDHPGIVWKTLTEELQTNKLETHEIVDWLTGAGVIEKIGDHVEEWRLTEQCRALFNVSNVGATLGEAEKWVRGHLEQGSALMAREIASQLKMDVRDVTKLLRGLRSQGVAMIDPEGPQRGPNTRWVAR